MAAPDPRDAGGITAVVESWRRAGLAEAVELVDLPTSAWDSSAALQALQAIRAMARLLGMVGGRNRPDAVHLHASVAGSLYRKLALSLLCRLGRVPYIAHMHSGSFDRWLEERWVNRVATRLFFSGAAVTIVLGERWRERAEALGSKRIEILPNGIPEAERASLAEVQAARRLVSTGGAPPDRAVLLFYGRWAPVKGADRLAATLRSLDRDDYEVHLYGNGDRDWLARQFAGLQGEIRLGGWLEGRQKLAELGAAAALIAPSRAEGSPTALVEARAAGAPVIATDVGAVADALGDYELAWLLPPDDDAGLRQAIAALLDGRWPDPGAEAASPLPLTLRSEHAVERLVEIYRAISA
jgi:glycosyltransferase involved in cell wall biosynthesis